MEFPPQSLSKTATKLAIIRINQQSRWVPKPTNVFMSKKPREKLSPTFCWHKKGVIQLKHREKFFGMLRDENTNKMYLLTIRLPRKNKNLTDPVK